MQKKEIVAKPALPLIVVGVLKGYIKKPVSFMIKTIITLPKYIKSIDIDLPKEFIKSNAFMAHLYMRLQTKMSKQKAYELTRAAIICSALSVMQANFRTVEKPRNFENLKRYQQKTVAEGVTKLNTMIISKEDDKSYEYKVTRCVFFEFFNYLGMPELTKIMCSADNAIFNTYLPNEIRFERGVGKTIADGACECEFKIIKN